MKFYLTLIVLSFIFCEGLAITCYTCVNEPIDVCLRTNQTCGYGMDRCYSMQKQALDGSWLYTKLCGDYWYCERTDAACADLDEPEYSYLDCNVGCCSSDFCNGADRVKSLLWMAFAILVPLVVYL